jgi:SAM-dependent methyltransferase
MGALGILNGQNCCACGKDVPGFFFRSYRPFGCPYCHSSPRERFVMYAFGEGLIPAPLPGGRILHVAPGERNIIRHLRSLGEWIGADIHPREYGPDVIELDVTTMDFDEPFTLIYASHILEHIPDDTLAIRMIFDHLLPGGIAIILVPLRGDTTEEGGPQLSGAERLKRFGQADHVRQYGMDIVGRLERGGFEVTVIDSKDAGPELIHRHQFETHGYAGDEETDRVFVCQRPL